MATTRVLAKEDGNLSQSTLIGSRRKEYKDIDLSFTAKPNGEIFVKKEAAAVKQAVKNLILTDYFEKPFEPFYGGNIRALLFELADDDVEEETRENIIRAINAYEPRAIVREVSVSYQEERNSISIYIEFQVINTEEVVTFTTSLSRLR
jgi:phage baseplate assembly protein W